MTDAKIRAIVVDDSALMRQLLTKALTGDDTIDVVAVAVDAFDARDKIKKYNPDVITLDIEMPNMDGLSFLERIMRLRPMPVVMISTLTEAGADATLRALEIGAVDFHLKPTSSVDFAAQAAIIREKVRAAAAARPGAIRTPRTQAEKAPSATLPVGYDPNGRLVAIGSSTGGVEALHVMLSGYPANCPPTVITQHMPERFTKAFAERLEKKVAAKVEEAIDGRVLATGHILIAPGGASHLEVVRQGLRWQCRLKPGPQVSGHRPSVDVLFHSVAEAAGSRAVGVILTGMGSDGARGLKEIRERGGHTLGQSAESCVVYGMPRVARELGAVEQEQPIERMADSVIQLCRRKNYGERNAQGV